jgi:hypothetical protein
MSLECSSSPLAKVLAKSQDSVKRSTVASISLLFHITVGFRPEKKNALHEDTPTQRVLHMKRYLKLMIFLFLHTILPHADAQDRHAAAICESLAALPLPDTTITLAQTVAAGALDIHPKYFPASLPGTPPLKELPAFCRVAADIRPTKDSDIKIEVWMPLSGWNGKFQSVGNGALSGAIWYPFLAENLSRG